MNENVKESVRALLAEIVDYAGLFPPSQLSMAEAVLNYATYKNSNYNWMLSRFVLPAARLDEFLESANDFISRDNGDVWRLAVLAGEDIYDTLRRIEDFNAKNGSRVIVDALEVRATTESKIENTVNALSPDMTAYFEIPTDERLPDLVSALAIRGQRAKIRTGGVTTDVFPPSKSVIRFIRTCLAANVPFKATAGLHHPLRCFKPLTYEADAPEGQMNGFLNMFLMTAFARYGFKPIVLEQILMDESARNFKFDENGVWWRNEYFLNNSQLERVRHSNIISFGSCSFTEPIEDLQDLELL
ncbi:MAG: hypothetical protein ABIP06_15215 [Pyrinomonadaceae bacterium]